MKAILTIFLLFALILLAPAAQAQSAEDFIKAKQARAAQLRYETKRKVEDVQAGRAIYNIDSSFGETEILSKLEPAAGNGETAPKPPVAGEEPQTAEPAPEVKPEKKKETDKTADKQAKKGSESKKDAGKSSEPVKTTPAPAAHPEGGVI